MGRSGPPWLGPQAPSCNPPRRMRHSLSGVERTALVRRWCLCRGWLSPQQLCFRLVPSPGGDAGLSVPPPEIPQVLASRLDVWLLQPRVVANLVPFARGIQIAGIEANASRFVRNLSLLKEVLRAAVEVENLLLVFDCFVAISLESV